MRTGTLIFIDMMRGGHPRSLAACLPDLAITRDIIRSHRGEIVLGRSKLGGLKVVLRIPV